MSWDPKVALVVYHPQTTLISYQPINFYERVVQEALKSLKIQLASIELELTAFENESISMTNRRMNEIKILIEDAKKEFEVINQKFNCITEMEDVSHLIEKLYSKCSRYVQQHIVTQFVSRFFSWRNEVEEARKYILERETFTPSPVIIPIPGFFPVSLLKERVSGASGE